MVLLAPSALAAHCSSLEFSTSLPSPTRAEPGRQSAEWGGDAFLSSSKAGGRVRSEGEAQPAQAQAPPLELNVGHHLCAEQAGGWGLTLPETGRYLSPEPLGLMGGLSPFGYAANDPIHVVDPDGLARRKPHPGMTARASGGGVTGSGLSAGPSGTSGEDVFEDLHPAVQDALLGPNRRLEGGRHAANCADPRAVSDYLKRRNAYTREEITTALSEMEFQASVNKEGGKERAPCQNCSQMFANLMAEYGQPQPAQVGGGALAGQSGNDPYATNFSPPPENRRGFWKSYDNALARFRRNNS